jgi:signal transduction histidine kinase
LLATLDRLFRPRLALQVLAATLVGTAAALTNVWIVASLMFVNTAHDLRLLVALLLGGAVVTTFFAVTAASMTGRRLDTITEAIGRLVALDYTPPAALDGRGGGEVARLAEDVGRLRVRLAEIGAEREALDSDRRYFTAAISHDLRTPVATVRALVDALDDGVVEAPAEVADYYRRIRHETQRLARMIDDLSELAQIDAGALRLDLSELPLQEVAAEVVEAMRPLADQSAVTLSLSTAGSPPPVAVDAARMERVLANLLRNALEHTEPGGTVEVRAAAEADCVLIAVADTGHGVSEADLGRIWDRFYRAERSRHRSPLGGDGSGLGLAIVQGIVEAHGGSVAVSGGPEGGACFEVRVPLGERF